MKQMVGYRVQDGLGGLRARCIVKENGPFLQSGKRGANIVYRELCHGLNDIPVTVCSWQTHLLIPTVVSEKSPPHSLNKSQNV